MVEKFPSGMLTPDAERYFGVTLERMEGKIDHILEYIPVIDGKIDALTLRVDRIEARLDVMEGDIILIKQEVKQIRVELKSKVSQEQFSALEKRVRKIEQDVGI